MVLHIPDLLRPAFEIIAQRFKLTVFALARDANTSRPAATACTLFIVGPTLMLDLSEPPAKFAICQATPHARRTRRNLNETETVVLDSTPRQSHTSKTPSTFYEI